ncbi:tetratricopeptide repeat protein [Pseudomonas sp. YH-1]|uniref:tetratricopeptide repeat protein n=1 Tax=Pseudomonas sp. YH-1 TaxID=3384787 RepID=UPI003F8023FF
MQSELIKKRIIGNLIDEVVELDASTLEVVGHSLIELLEAKRLIHHGLNRDYRPVGYTIDTFSQDFLVAGEYSAEKEYFQGKVSKTPAGQGAGEQDAGGADAEAPVATYSKIEKDVQHVLDHAAGTLPHKIYLICSQEEPESFRAKFNRTAIAREHGERLNILDAREVARLIFEFSTQNQTAAAFYATIFPGFAQDLDNHAYYGKAPASCEYHVSDPVVVAAIRDHFDQGSRVCLLTGLSGSGKTQAAIDYLQQEGQHYENYLWVSGADWKQDTSLSSVQRARGGVAVNVAGIFNSYRTLLVIDSLERELGERALDGLAKGFARGGRVLVTSQLNPPSKSALRMPTISTEAAAMILGESGQRSAIATKFIETCRFSPLILATVRKLVEAEGVPREELYEEILADPQVIADGNGAAIMERILRRLDPVYLRGLQQIANSGSFANDARFLGHFLGHSVKSRLQGLSILRPAVAPELLSVHDLICQAVRDKPDAEPIVTALTRYVEKHSGEMIPSVIRQIHLCAPQLTEVYQRRLTQQPDWLTYALLQLDSGQSLVQAQALHLQAVHGGAALPELLCVIDAQEAFAYSLDHDDRRQHFSAWAEEYGQAQQGDPTSDVNLELLHHQGKALRRCGRLPEALSCFQRLLEIRPEWHATYLQIAHMGTQNDADHPIKAAGMDAMRILIERVLAAPLNVPLRVSLAAVARLRSYRKVADEMVSHAEQVQVLADVIALSALEGLDQFYEAYLSFTSIFAYLHPEICVALAEGCPEILSMPPALVDKGQWSSACESLGNTAAAVGRAGKTDLRDRITAAGIAFATALGSQTRIKSFDARAVAKMFLFAGMPEDALAVITKISPEILNQDHWLLYRKAEAELGVGKPEDGLMTAELALALAQHDKKGLERVASYHELLSKCHEALGAIDAAIAQMEAAVSASAAGKYRQALSVRLGVLKEGANPPT